MRPVHDVYLVPGFFGFANLGRLTYFGHLRPLVLEGAAERGIKARVHVVRTDPTASLTRRAACLAETIAATASRGTGPVHLVGHSSGGIDTRLFTAPGVVLPTEVDVEALASRVRSVVAVSSPHHGTPLAEFLAGRLGEPALRALSVSTIYLLRYGTLPLQVLLQMSTVLARLDSALFDSTLLDQVFTTVLGDFSIGRRRAVAKLFERISKDQSLLTQLTPASMQVFGATIRERPGLRRGSVVTRSARPGLRSAAVSGLDPAAQALHAVFAALYQVAAQGPVDATLARTSGQERVLRSAYRKVPRAADNDGIVPTLSQVWGTVIGAVTADHLDVIGHFADPATRPPHVDWMTSGSGFARLEYEELWESVLDFLFAEETVAPPARRGGKPAGRSANARPPRRAAARPRPVPRGR